MRKRMFCCDECFGIISQKNDNASGLWLDICDLYYEVFREGSCVKYLTASECPELRTLEQLRFIVSTDLRKHVLIKLSCIHVDENGFIVFCKSPGEHHE